MTMQLRDGTDAPAPAGPTPTTISENPLIAALQAVLGETIHEHDAFCLGCILHGSTFKISAGYVIGPFDPQEIVAMLGSAGVPETETLETRLTMSFQLDEPLSNHDRLTID